MTFYPEDVNGWVAQLWHSSKWLNDLPDDMLTPMVIHPISGAHYYVGELCRCDDSSWFIPQRWFNKAQEGMWALGLEVAPSEVRNICFNLADRTQRCLSQSGLVVSAGAQVGRALSSMVLNWEDIIYEFGSAPKFSGVCCACSMSLHTSHIHRLLNAIFDWHAQHSTRCRKKSTNILYPCDGI